MAAVYYTNDNSQYTLKPEFYGKRIIANPGTGKSFICSKCANAIDGDLLFLASLSKLMSLYGKDYYSLKTTDDIPRALARYTSRRSINAPGWYELRRICYRDIIKVEVPADGVVLFAQVDPIVCAAVDFIFIQDDIAWLQHSLRSPDRCNKDISYITDMNRYIKTFKKLASPFGYTAINGHIYLADILCNKG